MEDILIIFGDLLRGVRDRAHWGRFFRSGLWLGTPFAGGVAFGIIFLLQFRAYEAARAEAWVAAAITAVAWLGGVWYATRTEAEPASKSEHQTQTRGESSKSPRRAPSGQLLIYYGILAFGVVLVLLSLFAEGEEIAEQSGRMSDGAAFIVYWLLAVSAISLPGWISRKLK